MIYLFRLTKAALDFLQHFEIGILFYSRKTLSYQCQVVNYPDCNEYAYMRHRASYGRMASWE